VEWIIEDWSEIPGRDNELLSSPCHLLKRSGTHAVSYQTDNGNNVNCCLKMVF
jgi:hypothetical protein